MKRVAFGILLIFIPFIAPWWLAILIAILGLFYYENLYEVIFVGMCIDILYGVRYEFLGFSLIFTLTMTVLFYVISKFKTQIFI